MKKNKKIFIIISILILLLTLIFVTSIYLNKNKTKKEDNQQNDNQIQQEKEEIDDIEYTYSEEGPTFVCSNKLLYSKTLNYNKGDYVYCQIAYEMSADRKGIKEIWFETSHDEDIEYIEVAQLFPDWKLDSKNGIMHLTTEKSSSYGDGAYIVKFRITPSTKQEKLKISFNNIKYLDEENKYYKTDNAEIILEINKETNYYYEQSEDEDSLIFYKFDTTKGYEKINEYKCTAKNCFPYIAQCMAYLDLDNGMTFIVDNNTAVLYDFNKGIIEKYDTSIFALTSASQYSSYKYFVVRDLKTKKYGIIDLKGNVIKEFESDFFGINQVCDISQTTYSIEKDLITQKINGKYGIVRITKDQTIIEHQYDDIRLHNEKYFKAKIDNKWYLYTYDNKKVIEDGYEQLFIINDEIIITQIDNYLYIKDYQGKNLTEDKIEVLSNYEEFACCGTNPGYNIKLENGIINFHINSQPNHQYEFNVYKYEYNIKTNKITEITE